MEFVLPKLTVDQTLQYNVLSWSVDLLSRLAFTGIFLLNEVGRPWSTKGWMPIAFNFEPLKAIFLFAFADCVSLQK